MIVTVFKQNYFRYQVTIPVVSASITEDMNPINRYINMLYAPHPNPVTKGSAHISFSIAEPSQITLNIYDALGILVKTLIDEFKSSGVYTVNWSGIDDQDKKVSEGVYFYVLKTNNYKMQKKMLMLK